MKRFSLEGLFNNLSAITLVHLVRGNIYSEWGIVVGAVYDGKNPNL